MQNAQHLIRDCSTVKSQYLEVVGTFFLQVQITRSANVFALRVIWTCQKVSDWRKQSKCFFDSERRFAFRRIRDIRVRDI